MDLIIGIVTTTSGWARAVITSGCAFFPARAGAVTITGGSPLALNLLALAAFT